MQYRSSGPAKSHEQLSGKCGYLVFPIMPSGQQVKGGDERGLSLEKVKKCWSFPLWGLIQSHWSPQRLPLTKGWGPRSVLMPYVLLWSKLGRGQVNPTL